MNFNEKTGLVAANRTQIFDSTHRIITEKEILFPRRCPEIEEFTTQLCNPYKYLKQDKNRNTAVYRYEGKNDHFRNALNYFVLAAHPKRLAVKKTLLQRMLSRSMDHKSDNNYRRSKF